MAIANLITGGTALFVFISGFFFHHVYYPKFQFGNFLIKKSKNVFLPYVILSSLAFIVFVVILDKHAPIIKGDTDGITNSIVLYSKYLWTGRILTAYWYIPFAMIVFLLSPLFIRYIHFSLVIQLALFTIWLGISMVVYRSSHNLSPVHSVIYFTPMYLLGIIYSIHEEGISTFLKSKSLALGVATVGASIIQVVHDHSFASHYKSTILSYEGIDITIIQKTLMIFFFLSVLKKIDHKDIRILKYFAAISFAIYFIHPWILETSYYLSITPYTSRIPGVILFLIKTAFFIVVSIIIATSLKKFLCEKSRYIIGY